MNAEDQPPNPPEWMAEIRDLLAQGRKIEAIRRYREQTSAGLKEAKDAVEAIERGQIETIAASDLGPDLFALLREGRKIEAIKRYREQTGAGLKQAKDAVEALARQHGIVVPRTGCAGAFGVSLLLALLTAALTWFT